MKRLTVKAIAAVLLLAGATVGVRAYFASQKDKLFNVNTAAVTRGALADEVSATGTLQAVTTVQVGTQVSGTVSWLGADFNSIVHKGDVLAKLDSLLAESQVSQSRASLARASADVENARAQLKNARQKQQRLQSLWAKQLVSQNDFDAATLDVALAEAQEKSAGAQVSQATAVLHQNEVALSQTVISSPIDGIVIQRNVDVGQTVSASVSSPTIFAIAADLSTMQVSAGIDESDIARIRPQQLVRFSVDAHPGEKFEGTVTQVRLQPTLAQNVTTYTVIISAPNRELKLKPGMTASVAVQIASRDDVLRVPNAALRFKPTPAMYSVIGQAPAADAAGSKARASEHSVWLYANDQLLRVPVQLGITDGQVTELVEGDLAPDAVLVTNVTIGDVRSTASATPAGGFFMNTQPGGAGRQGGTGVRTPRG
jgi:HlyD family secretion protein